MRVNERLLDCTGLNLTLVECRNSTKGRFARTANSCSTPMMMPLSIKTAERKKSERRPQIKKKPRHTQRIEIQRNSNTLLDFLNTDHTAAVTCMARLEIQSIEPHPHPLCIIRPQRVFKGADTPKMKPAELNTISKDLNVVFDLFVSRLWWEIR